MKLIGLTTLVSKQIDKYLGVAYYDTDWKNVLNIINRIQKIVHGANLIYETFFSVDVCVKGTGYETVNSKKTKTYFVTFTDDQTGRQLQKRLTAVFSNFEDEDDCYFVEFA